MNNVIKIPLNRIDNFEGHPFKVNHDSELNELIESIKSNGLLNPIVVRKKNNRYELISGHRRKEAFFLLGYKEIDSVVKELTDEEAIIQMVDSNIYREKILPSEKAFAYKMKIEAVKRQKKLKSGPEDPKLRSSEIVGNSSGECEKNIRRYIRLTNLIPELLQLVDNTVLYNKRNHLTMGIKPAVELSYLTKEEQKLVYELIKYDNSTPNHAQTIQIKELSKNKLLDFNHLEELMNQNKGNQNDTIVFNKSNIENVLPMELINRDKRYIEKYIIEAISHYNQYRRQVK